MRIHRAFSHGETLYRLVDILNALPSSTDSDASKTLFEVEEQLKASDNDVLFVGKRAYVNLELFIYYSKLFGAEIAKKVLTEIAELLIMPSSLSGGTDKCTPILETTDWRTPMHQAMRSDVSRFLISAISENHKRLALSGAPSADKMYREIFSHIYKSTFGHERAVLSRQLLSSKGEFYSEKSVTRKHFSRQVCSVISGIELHAANHLLSDCVQKLSYQETIKSLKKSISSLRAKRKLFSGQDEACIFIAHYTNFSSQVNLHKSGRLISFIIKR